MLGIGCDKGTENYEKDSANLEFPTRGVRGAVSPPGKHCTGGVEGIASWLRSNGGATGATFPCWLKRGLNVENTSRAKRFVGGKLDRNVQRDFGRRELNRRGSDVDVHLDVATVQHFSDTIWRPFAY